MPPWKNSVAPTMGTKLAVRSCIQTKYETLADHEKNMSCLTTKYATATQPRL